jgi:hypothetical protein
MIKHECISCSKELKDDEIWDCDCCNEEFCWDCYCVHDIRDCEENMEE